MSPLHLACAVGVAFYMCNIVKYYTLTYQSDCDVPTSHTIKFNLKGIVESCCFLFKGILDMNEVIIGSKIFVLAVIVRTFYFGYKGKIDEMKHLDYFYLLIRNESVQVVPYHSHLIFNIQIVQWHHH